MDDVTSALFFVFITFVAEIVIKKTVMYMWEKGSSSKRDLLILRRNIFQLQGL